MATQQPNNNPERIPLPIERDTLHAVENVYPNGVGSPDYLSQDLAGNFLTERIFPRKPRLTTTIIATPTRRTLPRFTRVDDGEKERKRFEHDGWIISPKVAFAATILGLVAFNGVQAAEDTREQAEIALHDMNRLINGPVISCDAIIVPTEITPPDNVIKENIRVQNNAGSSTVDSAAVDRFSGKVKVAKSKGGTIKSIEIIGLSSDDYGTNDSLGKPEAPDQDMADDRARAYLDPISEKFPGTQITTRSEQDTLDNEQLNTVKLIAEQTGYTGSDNIIDAIRAVESGRERRPLVRKIVDKLFSSKRGVTLQATMRVPGETTITPVPVLTCAEIPDNPPENKDHTYIPFLVPPIPRIRRVLDRYVPKKKWAKVPGKTIYKYGLLHEKEDQQWVQLRPEAVNDDGTLCDAPWAYTPKYEHLLRDGRIADLLRADFTTKSGEQKSLRIMFVDKSPAQETIDYFSKMLETLAQIEDGKIADRVSGIFVYPSDNAGTWHHDPKLVALGQSQQLDEHVLGSYTPLLDLVELHMPTTWDPDKVSAMLGSFYGPGWTMAHEAGGHGSDDTDNQLVLQPVRARGLPNAHVVVGNPWAEEMADTDRLLKNLPKEPGATIWYDITYETVDKDGRTVDITARVTEDDPRKSHAKDITVVGRKPTTYGSTNPLEHYAETAASLITGIEIPMSEAGSSIQPIQLADGSFANFATGYRPDQRSQDIVTESAGAELGEYPLKFTNPVEVVVSHINPANDKLIREHLIRARESSFPHPSELINVLTNFTSRKSKTRNQ